MQKTRHRQLFKLTYTLLSFIASGVLIMSYVSAFINPAKVWIMTIFGLIHMPMVFINILLMLWGIYKHRKSFIITLIALLPSIFLIGRYVHFYGDSNKEGDIKVLTYNVGKFELSKHRLSTLNNRDSIINFIKRNNPDIVCLQEFKFPVNVDIKKYLVKLFPHYNNIYFVYPSKTGHYGNITLTKYPIADKGIFHFENSTNLAIYCDCKIGNDIVRIYNCHLQSYSIAFTRLLKDMRNNYKSTMRQTEIKLRDAIAKRPKQVLQIIEDMQNCPYKALIAGDFNEGPMSYTYYKLSNKQKDSFVSSGRGFAATYSVLWPLLRIDYILYPDIFLSKTHKVIKKKFSDHYPVVATFTLNT